MTLIFDYDGTIHDCFVIYKEAFLSQAIPLQEQGIIKKEGFTDKDIKKWIGVSPKEMWETFMPELAYEIKYEASKNIGKKMLELIYNNKAQLYPGAIEVLKKLKNDGYNMVILSNCHNQYLKAHIKAFSLEKYFNDFYPAEKYQFIEKYLIFEYIKKEHEGPYIVIGDRASDYKVAKENNTEFLACMYGYSQSNELDEAIYLIDDIKMLPATIKKIEKISKKL